ncbi:MAG: molybdopterin-dependent oxidoreductase, partial [Pseudomonadota bacterium]
AAPLCDIPADQIRALAAELARERVMISTAWSLQRGDHGEQVIWSALALAALLGQIGLPGTGYGFGYGCTAMPGRPKRQIHWPAIPQKKNPVADFIPVARVCDMLLNPGDPYTYNCESRLYPDIRLVYWVGGNPFHHHQDLMRLSRAWTRPETVIVNEHSWTATARRADIVLPCTTPLERDDLMINRRDPRLIYLSQVLPVQGEARNDFDIFAGLADRLGTADSYTEGRDGNGWIRWLWDRCAETAHQEHGIDLPDFETLRRDGFWTVPEADATRTLFGDFIDDPGANRLATETGRLTLYNRRIAEAHLPDCPGHPCWMAPAEWTFNADPDQLHLISNQPATRLHGQLDNSASTRAAKQQGREVCTMHPDAAHARGLVSGDIVRIFNDRGACLSAVTLDRQMREDCLVLPTGAWLDLQNTDAGVLCVHGNPNMLTLDKGTSGLAQGNIAHTTLVRVEKWTGTAPPVRVHDAPQFVEKNGGGDDD